MQWGAFWGNPWGLVILPSDALLQPSKVRVTASSLDYLTINWLIKPTNRDIAEFTFSVWRSQSQDSASFRKIVDGLKEIFVYKDPNVNIRARNRVWYYKVRSTEDLSSDYLESLVSSSPEKLDRVGIAIARRNDMLMDEFVGVPCFVLQSKMAGQRCPSCWDELKQRVNQTDCKACFNTGWLGGYAAPIEAQINFNPAPKLVQIAQQGEMNPQQTVAWLGNFPEVKPRDIIIEVGPGTRWRVVNRSTTQKRRVTVHQNLTLKQINLSDVEWSIPVPGLLEDE